MNLTYLEVQNDQWCQMQQTSREGRVMLHGLETKLGECHSLSLGEHFQWNVLLCMLTASDYEVGLPKWILST